MGVIVVLTVGIAALVSVPASVIAGAPITVGRVGILLLLLRGGRGLLGSDTLLLGLAFQLGLQLRVKTVCSFTFC